MYKRQHFARLRAEDPVHFNEIESAGRYWSIMNYDDVRAIDGDWENFSSAKGMTLGLRPTPENNSMFQRITPFISMIKELPPIGYRVYLFYSVKTRSEIIDWRLLYDEMITRKDTIRIIPFVGDEQGALLDVDFIERASGSLVGRDVYICGPPAMMKALKLQIKQRGVPATSIHSEEFSM